MEWSDIINKSMIANFNQSAVSRDIDSMESFGGKGFEYGRSIYLRRGNGRAYITVWARG